MSIFSGLSLRLYVWRSRCSFRIHISKIAVWREAAGWFHEAPPDVRYSQNYCPRANTRERPLFNPYLSATQHQHQQACRSQDKRQPCTRGCYSTNPIVSLAHVSPIVVAIVGSIQSLLYEEQECGAFHLLLTPVWDIECEQLPSTNLRLPNFDNFS